MACTVQHILRYGDIDVEYNPELDGGGLTWAPKFVEFIRGHFGNNTRFDRAFEWCAGPGFIGFALLAEGLCDSLCVADVNPAAVECVDRTILRNGLGDRVRCYLSDNFRSIPNTERFDLVIGNPPNFYSVNREHPLFPMYSEHELRASDPGWKVHSDFYSEVGLFLAPGASVLVQEVEPTSREVYFGNSTVPWDVRPDDQASIFPKMIQRGGLKYIGDFEFKPSSLWNSRMQVSEKSA
jgi:hypothetical protein